MKTVILLSSIFYILGLKIGHKIDVVRAPVQIQKITNATHAVKSAAKSISFNSDSDKTTAVDSLRNNKETNKKEQQIKHF